MILTPIISDFDPTTVVAYGGLIIGLASAIAQIIKMIIDNKNSDARLPSQIKLDESTYAKNAIEAANMATEARLKLEAHTLDLDKRIEELGRALERLEQQIIKLNKKNKILIRAIAELLGGVEKLLSQFKDVGVVPSWVPTQALKNTVNEEEVDEI